MKTWISGFQVVIKNWQSHQVIRDVHHLRYQIFEKKHGWVIFYQVFSFPGIVKMEGSVKLQAGFLVSRWH